MQSDEHFLTVCRYIEHAALRANFAERALEDWSWRSMAARSAKADHERPALTPWPIERPRDWRARVNRAFGPKEGEAILRSILRGQLFASVSWQTKVAARLGLGSTFRPRGHPRKALEKGS